MKISFCEVQNDHFCLQESCRGTLYQGVQRQTRRNRFKLEEGRFKLDVRKNSLL